MPAFQYKARSPHGDAIEGTIEASSTSHAASRLIEGKLTPVDIQPARQAVGMNTDLADIFPPKVELIDLIQFSRQMHSLLKAGVPILSSLSGLARHSGNRTLTKTLVGIIKSLEAGHDLSSSMAHHPKVFSVFYVSLIRIGETSGQLEAIFQQLSAYLQREKKTRDQIKSTVRYPIFVLFAIAIAIAVINIFVVPAFANIFAQFGAELPLPTKILVAMSDITVNHWQSLLILGVLLTTGLRMYTRSETGRYKWHKAKLRLPVVGSVLYQASLARFTRLFALLQKAGIPIVTGLSVVGQALDNDFIKARVLSMRDGIERGESLSNTAENTGVFDHLVLQMLQIGEASGATDDLLLEVADYYDAEVEYAIEKLSTSIEPLMTVTLAGLVFLLATGIFLPMWDMAGAALH
ncbi:MSHA biogenesis protein MshG [hydrothermal vent metagenome]|uniref:MSHA biogenesis protein MshG n=1 Tax=hydrothermal vent metagenome TaxID=652676 RepID=A0A3B0Z1M6_9ZZZZ